MNPTRISIFMKTTDNWAGNYKINNDRRHPNADLVEVSLILMRDGDYRVCVWGNDDFGMEYDTESHTEAESLFFDLIRTGIITVSNLKQLGFISS